MAIIQRLFHRKIDSLTDSGAALIKNTNANPKPVPMDQWPDWALILKSQRRDGEAGVGDTAARIIGAFGGEQFKDWYKKIVGRSCGCSSRQQWMNSRFAYSNEEKRVDNPKAR